LAIKSAPKVIYKGLTAVIGQPEDYQHNKSNDNFPDNYNLRIPTAPRVENPEESQDAEIKDLSQP